MKAPTSFQIQDEQFWMSPDRCIYWERERALIISDTHIGKTGHFRKSGIAVPQKVYTEDLQRLITLIYFFKAEQLIVVGDFSHSRSNRELDLFSKWRADFSLLQIHLVKGNHDILEEQWYRDSHIQLHGELLCMGKIAFRHDLPDSNETMPDNSSFLFTGHIHPGVKIRGMGKQSLRFPCFYFTDSYCILPAFSRFTGLASISTNPSDTIFAIVEDSLLRIQ